MKAAFVACLVVLLPTSIALIPPLTEPTIEDPAEVGRWLAPFEGEVAAVNMILLHTNEVLYYSGVEAGDHDNVFFMEGAENAKARVLDLGSLTVNDHVDPGELGYDLFCSGNTVLPDGRVLVAGGTSWSGFLNNPEFTPLWGTGATFTFDATANAWEQEAYMDAWRWYPSLITTPEGDGLVASGVGTLVDPQTQVQLIERYHEHGGVSEWHDEEGADRLLPLYPRIHVVPGGPYKGDLFYQTVGTLWGPFGEHPLEAFWSRQQVLDFDTDAWRDLDFSVFGARQHAAVVPLMLEPGRGYAPELLTFGGTLQRTVAAVPFAERADLAEDPPVNTMADTMEHPRWHLNGVLLPDGTVLAVGGGLYDTVVVHGQPNIPVLPAERYDPDADQWTEMAAMEVPRMYHSTAVLLPDGRVLAGGHVPLPIPWKAVRDNVPTQAQIVETRFEIYEPPYLFWGDRPEILGAPEEASYGQLITLGVDNAHEITGVVLVRPGATTHSFDSEQRGIELNFGHFGNSAVVAFTPPDATVAPPGWYMLFVLKDDEDDRGKIPSEAAWVHLG